MSKEAREYILKHNADLYFNDKYVIDAVAKTTQAYADEQNRELKEMMLDLARELKELKQLEK